MSGLLRAVSPTSVYAKLNKRMLDNDVVLHCTVELQPPSEYIELCTGNAVEVNCTTFIQDISWETTPDCFLSYDNDNAVGLGGTFCDFEAILLSTSPSLMSKATLSNV